MQIYSRLGCILIIHRFKVICKIDCHKVAISAINSDRSSFPDIKWKNSLVRNIFSILKRVRSSASCSISLLQSRILTVHKHIICIMINLINLIGRNLDMLDSNRDRDWGDGYSRVENLGNKYSHISDSRCECVVVNDFHSNWISLDLRLNQSAF